MALQKKLKMKEYLIKMRILIVVLVCTVMSCHQEVPYMKLQGNTMGTTYHITIQSEAGEILQQKIDSLLEAFNQELSTYIISSTISSFNAAKEGMKLNKKASPHFYEMMIRSREIHKNTQGAFDPSIGPLVDLYGFGNRKLTTMGPVDSDALESTLKMVGFNKIKMEESQDSFHIFKSYPEMTIDFSSIAKGYGVDLVANLLNEFGVENYLVEIGGESRALGVNAKGKVWTLGINRPEAGASFSDVISVVHLNDKSLATSGNYRNFYDVDSITYVHIIDPVTGMSRPSDILSATVLADDCATADAYATAFIVMGVEKAMKLVNEIDDIEACFIVAPSGKYEFRYSEHYKNFMNE